MDIKSFGEYKTAMKKAVLEPVIKNISKEVVLMLKKYIKEEWYDSHSSNFYNRTYDFLNSVTSCEIKMNGYDFSMEIYIDYNDMRIFPPSLGDFGARTSINGSTSYGGKPIGYWLVQWIEEGQNSPINSYDGIHMFEKISEQLYGSLDGIIKKSLSQIGFKSFI